MRSLVLGVLVAVAAGVAACGEEAVVEPQPARPATLAELTGPWQPRPFLLDPALREHIAHACRRDMGRQPASVTAVIDARGGGLVTVRMTGVTAGECSGIGIAPDGQLTPGGGGGVMDGVEVPAKLGEFDLGPLEVSGGAGGELLPVDVGQVVVFGRAGAGIATVVIEPVGRPSLVASLENGWFGAWWPIPLGEKRPDGRVEWPVRAFELVAQGYDSANSLVAEVRQ